MAAAELPQHASARALTSISRNGWDGTAERVRAYVVKPLVEALYLDERHVWYEVPISPLGATMPEGYQLRRGDVADLPALADIGGIDVKTGRAYLDHGSEMYVVTHGEELAFSTWIHPGSVPVLAAPDGVLDLPDGVVCIEDSITARRHRGAGIAMQAINEVTAIQHRHGVHAIITKIACDNAAARRVMEKMGGTEVASMRLRRFGPVRRVRISPADGGNRRLADLLAARMVR